MLALPPNPGWTLRAEADEKGITELYDQMGHRRQFGELREQAGNRYLAELHPEIWERKYQMCMEAMARLDDDIIRLKPDLLVIVGDDQDELFSRRNTPSIAVSYAATVQSAPSHADGLSNASVFRAKMGMDGHTYPGDTEAALHLIEKLMETRFDLGAVGEVDQHTGFGHAFTWVLARLLNRAPIPSIPILLNTYFPPNQPAPERCLEFGQVLRQACESLPGDRRVIVVASGGLSHFVVDPELDERVLDAIRNHDLTTLARIPAAQLNSGTSEIRNWITMCGTSEGLACQWMEYQPVYRTAAGTGCGLAFALLA